MLEDLTVMIINLFLLLLRQGLTSIPFLFVSVTNIARRNLVHVKRIHGNRRNFVVPMPRHFFAFPLLYAKIVYKLCSVIC